MKHMMLGIVTDILEEIYGENAEVYMLNEKAYLPEGSLDL